jgi:hypothetical protein
MTASPRVRVGRRAWGTIGLIPLIILFWAAAAMAEAQQRRPPPKVPVPAQPALRWPGMVEISAGAALVGGYPLGTGIATLTPNQQPPVDRFTLFRSSSDLQRTPAVEAMLAYHLTRRISLEGGFAYSTPIVRTSISEDAEGAPPLTFDGQQISQYVIDGSLVVHLPRLSFRGGRGMPFARGGLGYLRQLHEGAVLVETGRTYHVGGGVKYLFRVQPRRALKGMGLRADARVNVRTGGFDLEEERRTYPSVGAGFLLAF